jgi:hypothetical protein
LVLDSSEHHLVPGNLPLGLAINAAKLVCASVCSVFPLRSRRPKFNESISLSGRV